MAGSLGLLVGCAHHEKFASSFLSATNAPPPMNSNELAKANAELMAAMSEGARKEFENILRGIPEPPSHFPFPDVSGEPNHPRPNYVNFYGINDHYPDYLLCEYDVEVKNYHQSYEPKWFKAALKQARRSGPTKFPPIKWIAVAICNVAEHKDAGTFEQSFKVGAIFNANDVFDSLHDLSQLITDAEMDRHPFKYDTSQPTPGEQQRWVIVERHAATNSVSMETK